MIQGSSDFIQNVSVSDKLMFIYYKYFEICGYVIKVKKNHNVRKEDLDKCFENVGYVLRHSETDVPVSLENRRHSETDVPVPLEDEIFESPKKRSKSVANQGQYDHHGPIGDFDLNSELDI